jgi:hypothetical protein
VLEATFAELRMARTSITSSGNQKAQTASDLYEPLFGLDIWNRATAYESEAELIQLTPGSEARAPRSTCSRTKMIGLDH